MKFYILFLLLPLTLEGQQEKPAQIELPKQESLFPLSGQPQIEMNRHNRNLRDAPEVLASLSEENQKYVVSHTFPWLEIFLFLSLFFSLPLIFIYMVKQSF